MVAYKAIKKIQEEQKSKEAQNNSLIHGNKSPFEVNYHLREKAMNPIMLLQMSRKINESSSK
jgi:hypothetical protein